MINIKRDGEFSYSSTQLDLSTIDRNFVQDYIQEKIDMSTLHSYGIEENSHITVLYGLHDETPTNVQRILLENKIESIKVMLGLVTIFDQDSDYDVLKIDVISGDLRKLNKLFLDSLEVTSSFPLYVPHITLGYFVKGEAQKYVGDNYFEGRLLEFNKLTFSPSTLDDTRISFLTGEFQNG